MYEYKHDLSDGKKKKFRYRYSMGMTDIVSYQCVHKNPKKLNYQTTSDVFTDTTLVS